MRCFHKLTYLSFIFQILLPYTPHSVETCLEIYIQIITNLSSNQTHQIRHVANVSIILIDNCCSNCCC